MAEKTVDLVVRPSFDAVVIRPGDTLVIRGRTDLSMQEADTAKAYIEARLPGVTALIVGAEQMLVYRPDGGDDNG